MEPKLPLFPEAASAIAGDVDHLALFLLVVAAFFTVLIFGTIFYFAIRYRRRSDRELPHVQHGGMTLEILWSVIPFAITMVMFVWGADLYYKESRPPDNALPIYVVGKQWMWKIEHIEGQREINELHIPVGRPVRLTMTSEDVIHSFFVPAFRTKSDVVPGKYSTEWFTATKPGKYHLFCAEYCGNRHSSMIGWVYAMDPQDYQNWLNSSPPSSTMAENGSKLFNGMGCPACHKPDGAGRCPSLVGLYGSAVHLADGRTILADEDYLRESILQPQAKIVAGYGALMPTFQGQVTEEDVVQLVEYIKWLGDKSEGKTPAPGTQGEPLTIPELRGK
ncbi:MAG TPA: cytochrome c oxidase subunit II [Bryobacteraceae bacterium]|jgi:cytochrome c oxidase subunit 2|nr:cytochrome c oxidase subunit II [Bryobacteraceae bacterium]